MLLLATSLACGTPALPPDPPLLEKVGGESLLNPSPVHEIVVEHMGCNGECPTYRVRLIEDGHWEWEGKRFVSPPGRLTGAAYASTFSQLFIWLQGHPALYAASTYQTECCDQEGIEFRFGLKSGESIVVRYSNGFRGDDFWALSTIVDAIILRAMSRAGQGKS